MSIARSVKARAKQLLVARQHKTYEKILRNANKDYNDWIRHKESQIKLENAGNLSAGLISFAECAGELYQKLYRMPENIIIFHQNDGEVSKLAKPLIIDYMTKHPNLSLVYGDEDEIEEMGRRVNPRFKPDWSPDLFLAKFYFGSIFAVRRSDALAVLEKMQKDGKVSSSAEQNLYRLCHQLARECMGFEKRQQGEIDTFPVGHISEVLFHNRSTPGVWKGSFPEEYVDCSGQLISVIIPSRDHPEILKRCIQSFVRYTRYKRYQFVIVDNGSTEENKKVIEALVEKLNQEEKGSITHLYLYEPMPFNFSLMCNMGVKAASAEAELLLFLNDDMEILQPDWLERLAGKAMIPRVGAVGAKLLYPDSDIIQHVGITNLRIGPAHKLQFLSDQEEHYYGKNRGVHNVAAATGACLMMRKAVFHEAGGFREDLAVAFNDVDLCYSIWEAGYYNVVLNNVTLFHHESLSRGNDGESEEKRIRLMQEREILYDRHRSIYGKDPFYHKYLVTDMLLAEYTPILQYEMDLAIPWATASADRAGATEFREDACLRIGVECITDLFEWKYGISAERAREENRKVSDEDQGYFLQGYSFVIGGDNACYQKILLLKNIKEGIVWQIPIQIKYRPDIKKELSDQLNVDLTGFFSKVKADVVPPGEYLVGIKVKDRCSRQKLVNWSDRQLIIKG